MAGEDKYFHYIINKDLELCLLGEDDAQALFDLTEQNREHLRQWLIWVDNIELRDFLTEDVHFVWGALDFPCIHKGNTTEITREYKREYREIQCTHAKVHVCHQ